MFTSTTPELFSFLPVVRTLRFFLKYCIGAFFINMCIVTPMDDLIVVDLHSGE